MKLLLSWVRDFVDVTAPAEEVADRLALRGFEVASIEDRGAGDAVIDFEVTANRPDCLGVLGFARELSAIYDVPLRPPSHDAAAKVLLAQTTTGASDRLKVIVENPELCPRYAAGVAEVIPTVTPAWMATRLHAAGVRPISPIVDITNYVLMELGHPMHAFDLATLAGSEIRVRRARQAEMITTLDGVERTLDSDMLVIADARRPQAIAGVMGGAGSEVSGTTRTIAFESASFLPSSVRRTSKRLGLKTEASARFERGTDVNTPATALQRALALMQQIGAGRTIGQILDQYPRPRGPRSVALRRARLALLLGLEVPDAEVTRILTALGMAVSTSEDGWNVMVPTVRVDVQREVDLIEEVGRHYGFEKLEPVFPPASRPAPAPDPRIGRDSLIRRVLTAAGLSEAVTFGFLEAAAALPFAPGANGGVVAVANPLSAKFDTLRPSLLPGLIDAVAHNRRHGRRDVGLFEIGARFTATDGETRAVAVAWTGHTTPEHWSGSAREADLFDVKGAVERVCDAVGVDAGFEPLSLPWLVPGQGARVRGDGIEVGVLGQLAPALADARGAPRQDPIFVAELNLDALGVARGAAATDRVQPLPRHPSIVRDISIVVANTLPAEIIRGTIQAAAAPGAAPLAAVSFFDRYTGKGIPEGRVSLSLRMTFQAADRTLTDGDVQDSIDRILAALVKDHDAVQR